MKKMEEKSFAMDLLEQSEKNAVRFYTIIKILIIVFGLLIAFIVSIFIWYINQPVDEITTEYVQDADTQGSDSPINQQIGE